MQYVNELDLCKNQRDTLLDQKKRLEEMKTVVSKYKSKEEGFQSLAQSSLQAKIESLTADIAEIDTLIQ